MTTDSESLSFDLARVRGRRHVQMTYDVDTGDGIKRRELPFVVGVLADLSGQPPAPVVPLGNRKFTLIDPDNFDAVLKAATPRLAFRVPNVLTADGSPMLVELRFQSMQDFEPAHVAKQVPALHELLEARLQPIQSPETSANWHSETDRLLSAQLCQIMHHPDFEKLEGAGRGLHYLVSQSETGETLKIRVLNVTRRELFIDQEQAVEFDQSVLFKKIHDEVYGWLGGEPYGLLVGDYEFSHSPEDVNLLKRISHIAAAAHAPFVASASPKMFGMERFGELSEPRVLTKIFDSVEYAPWKAFRESEDSRYVALTLPRVLCRLPYGVDFKCSEEINFEELAEIDNLDKFAWMSSAWPYAVRVTNAFAKYGWLARIHGHICGGKVEGLPALSFCGIATDDGALADNCPAEIAISDWREDELANLGFLTLHHDWDNTEDSVFLGAQSCHKSPKRSDQAANGTAELSAKLNVLLCASRWVHYLRIMARDKIGSFMETEDCQRWLNDWIMCYCVDPKGATLALRALRPLSDANVEIKPVTGKPGWFQLEVDLAPHYQLESLTTRLRLVSEIPRCG